MTPAVRALVAMCSAVGARNRAALAITIDAAAQQADPAQAEEALLQSYLFVGYPVALQALAMWRERTGFSAPAKSKRDAPRKWRERGEAVCEVVYAGQYAKLRDNISRLHPDMEKWMLEEGYGKVIGRPGLDLMVRELCIVGVLIGLDAPAQLYSHLRGAVNAGATLEDLEAAVEIACQHSSISARESAREVFKNFRNRRNEKDPSVATPTR